VSEPGPAALHGRWVHSHEEDAGGEQVFRPASFPFPPSRGRRTFELRGDGSYAGTVPGPTDKPEPGAGTWKLSGDELELSGDGSTESFHVVSAEPDRLVLRAG
jgi:lipocalin-like protein